MRRKNIKIREFPLQGAKLNSIFIARRLSDYFATGDSHNNVTLYTFSADQPLINFTSTTNANVQSQVSAVSISWEEDVIFSGSNRGIINIWDINSAKNAPIFTLKGHATSVNCFGIFPEEPDRLASGSYDTHIKLWDIRNKNNTGMLKHHTKPINSIDISPDGRYLLSGSQDATTKFWDLRYPEKLLATYSEHSAGVLKVKFNPEDCMFASCSIDKTAKYFRCETNHYNYISSTELVSMPVTAIDFSPDGKYLCTGGNDILKIWNMNKNGALVESIQSGWKGVHDMMWTQKGLLGLSSNSSALSVWYCDIDKKIKKNNSEMRMQNESKLPKLLKNSSERRQQRSRQEKRKKIEEPEVFENEIKNASRDDKYIKRQKELEDVLKNVNYALDIVNDIDDKKIKESEDKDIQKEREKERELQRLEQLEEEKRLNQERKEKLRQEKQKQREERQKKQRQRRQKLQRQKQEEQMLRLQLLQKQRIQRQKILHQKLQQTLQKNQNKEMDLTLENDILENSSIMNISAFMGDGVQKERLRQIELIGDIMKDSGKYSSVMTNRSNVIKPIIHLWKQGNIESALRALSQYSPKERDISVMSDCISSILHNKKFKSGITPDAACVLIQKLLQLLQNKHSTYVKAAMYNLNDIVMMFKDELIKVKMFNPMTRVDLSREQRLAKYDRLTDKFLTVFKQDRVRKYSSAENKSNEQLHRIAKELFTNLEEVLRKIMPKNQPEAA